MSNILLFPPSSTLPSIYSPPYAKFAAPGADAPSTLPPRLLLTMVHFTPETRERILPTPTEPAPLLTFPEIRLLMKEMADDADTIIELVHNIIRGFLETEYSSYSQGLIRTFVKSDEVLTSQVVRIQQTYGTDILEERIIDSTPLFAAAKNKAMEQNRTRRVMVKEGKDRERQCAAKMQRRLQRLRSDESIRSVDTVIQAPKLEGARGAIVAWPDL
ncbi:uncharacterized protein BDR25DRAFT_319808 [Lindgomyces ingoldianus]|uniref:Uncharacterized protein n=1 Tax=Lindgomyces ingoldianus TaxID=673940 RepID=A0ACB6Q9M3_9PLEO|nr:uncharacterized protein BDR25DRAFT_319808 [Lindgomyces ingoldianus]KAF2463601.1 hypothetical protein BDR25DRAFT_319808 [Lindgomyces ingoldianus]